MNLAEEIARVTALQIGESIGTLSPAERDIATELASHEERARASSRVIYDRAVERVKAAREALQVRLFHGLPEMKILPNGGVDGMVGLHYCEVKELVNAYARASRQLWEAAQMVCDLEDLPDDGEDDGIAWEMPL